MRPVAEGVTFHYRTRAGSFSETGDYAIITVPFRCCATSRCSSRCHVPSSAPYATSLRRSANSLPCKRRFWEEDEGIFAAAR